MAVDNILEDEEENILYDLLINTEWPPETDTQVIEFFRGYVFGGLVRYYVVMKLYFSMLLFLAL